MAAMVSLQHDIVAFDAGHKNLAGTLERVQKDFHVVILDFNNPSPDEWPLHKRAGIRALFTFGAPRITADTLALYPNLKLISNFGNGVDHIDLKVAQERKIPVGNTPDAPVESTADMGFGLLLACARNIVSGDAYARAPTTLAFPPNLMLGAQVSGRCIGIIGMGRIGQAVARRAAGFNMRVCYHNRHHVSQEIETALKAEYASMDDLLQRADFVVLTCPLSAETRHLISKDQLAKMKSSAILINIARGAVVDTAALTDALTNRRIWGAALDVTDPEPLPRDHPLLKLSNVVIAPHLGSATEETRHQMGSDAIANLCAGLAGQPLPNRVV